MTTSNIQQNEVYWFVGASFGSNNDQTERFLAEGIWENGYEDKLLDEVRSMKAGDPIAIKSAYTRKHNVPFDNRGLTVSVMSIKATGTVTKNLGDGRRIEVNWDDTPQEKKEWYFYTGRTTIWRILPGEWTNDALIDFTFNNGVQDYARFCNAPFWRERFGDNIASEQRFKWTKFYEAIADKLLSFKDRRDELIDFVNDLAKQMELKYIIGKKLDDICPFTVMGMFNRGITDENRKRIAAELAKFLLVTEAVPQSFEGIPVLNNQKSWFFGFEEDREDGDIDGLWDILTKAIEFSDTDNTPGSRSAFSSSYDQVSAQHGVGWNLTMALYWIRPWNFLTLDSQSQVYITKKLGIDIDKNGAKGRCSSKDYLKVLDALEVRFKEEAYPVHSFPELSLAAWSTTFDSDSNNSNWRFSVISKIKELCSEKGETKFSRQEFLKRYLELLENEFPDNNSTASTLNRVLQILRDDDLLEFCERGHYRWLEDLDSEENLEPNPNEDQLPVLPPYTLDNLIADGCFIRREKLAQVLERLKNKKNLILQGPPGTGKTWLAKRLAYTLMGQKNESCLRAVQFHPNLSYEDFVRGWRPSGEGKLTLVDGPFLEMVDEAKKNADTKYVVVIEEINRGNPAQIFGEMLTLLEADKRTPSEALELSYRKSAGERVFVPDNLYVIGTMNIADRSLALVDLALRRRFAFVDLEPTFGTVWREWVNKKAGIDINVLKDIEARLINLNNEIAEDRNLGSQFKVGHSYVTPAFSNVISDANEWFKQVVETEIGPLLDEYWFDDHEKSRAAQEKLLAGF